MRTLMRGEISLAALAFSAIAGIRRTNGAFHQPQWRLATARGPPQEPRIPHLLNWATGP